MKPAFYDTAYTGEMFDLRFVPIELRDDTRDYLLRHGLAWTEPCALCDGSMVRVDCPDCGGEGLVCDGGRYSFRDCDRCAATGWLMRCTGCGAWDDDDGLIAAERRSLGLEEPGAPATEADPAGLCAALARHTAYPIPTAIVDEGEPEAAVEFASQLRDMVAVSVGTLALLAGATTWAWLMGGLGR